MASAKLAKVEDALRHFKEGGIVLVMDSEDREDECDMIMSAETCTPENMAFMIKHSTGIVCVASDKERLEGFGLHPATGLNTDKNATNFYVSTDFLPTTTTGVSAYDRCETVKAFCDPTNPPESFSKPGHMFPLCARRGGVLERPGHTESTYDLCRLAGCKEYVGILAEMMHEDGTMYRKADSLEFSKKYNMPMVTVEQLIEYRKALSERAAPLEKTPQGTLFEDSAPEPSGSPDPLDDRISLAAESSMEVSAVAGKCSLKIFNVPASKGKPREEVVALVKGEVRGRERVPCRVHSECFTGDTLRSKHSDCGSQLDQYLRTADREPAFVLLYVRGHEGRGIGLANKIKAYKLQEQGADTCNANLQLGFPVDCRDYSASLEVLKSHLGLKSIALYTNNPEKMEAFREITAQVVPLATQPLAQNQKYLETKEAKCGHKTVLNTFKLPTVRLASRTQVGVVYATWNDYYVKSLLDGVNASLKDAGVTVTEMSVPGAADLVSGTRAMLRKHKPDAVICIGVLIKGSTDQHEMVGNATCHGLTSLNAMQDTPIVSGLLICKDETQAHDRSFGSGNHGAAWARTALTMVACNEEEEKRTP